MRFVILFVACTILALPSFATTPTKLTHAPLKTSKIAKAVTPPSCERSPGPVADKYCCCYVAQGINSVICGCAFCPLDKQPDPDKTIRPNNTWRVPELIETLR